MGGEEHGTPWAVVVGELDEIQLLPNKEGANEVVEVLLVLCGKRLTSTGIKFTSNIIAMQGIEVIRDELVWDSRWACVELTEMNVGCV